MPVVRRRPAAAKRLQVVAPASTTLAATYFVDPDRLQPSSSTPSSSFHPSVRLFAQQQLTGRRQPHRDRVSKKVDLLWETVKLPEI